MKTAIGHGLNTLRPQAVPGINAYAQLLNVKATARPMDLNFRTAILPAVVSRPQFELGS